ncbi:hypothetical protein [Mycobacteroides abscessus]|uniref:hypothetical protein n=1 Tax=Mycobacteroides abscessus TaxID=36809 RepID=UPI0026701A80|nr:hypothetical protein [Mycobacteroides abscessus]MDO3110487.1 hypothetical protein [Mycobacteroides abscessus subsp. abscessus]
MARLRDSTFSNTQARQQIMRQRVWKVRDQARAADAALRKAHKAPPAEALRQLVGFNSAHAAIEELIFELCGAAILGGMTAQQVSEATGIPAATLARRVPKQLTDLRGRHVTKDPSAAFGWREQ